MSSDDDLTPVPITSRQTGSRSVAQGAIVDCQRMADQLEARARILAMASGRPDLAMHRVAMRLRALVRRYEAWGADRTGKADREADRADTVTWYREGQDALAAHPAP